MQYDRRFIGDVIKWKRDQPIPHNHYSAFRSLHRQTQYRYQFKPLGWILGASFGLGAGAIIGAPVSLLFAALLASVLGLYFSLTWGYKKQWRQHNE